MSVQLTTAQYAGQARNFVRHGHGEFRYTPDFVYVGNFENNVKQGHGQLELIGIFKIAGEFRDGEITGVGTKKWENGNEYVGNFKCGELHGQGEFRSNKVTYTGDFRRNQFCGIGRLQTGESVYVGNFFKHKFHGEGELRTGELVYIGNFVNGDCCGKGVLGEKSTSRNWTHEGEFVAGKKNGPGKCWDDISKYFVRGEWRDDLLVNAPEQFVPSVAQGQVYLQTVLDDKKKKFAVELGIHAPFNNVLVVNAGTGAMLPLITVSVVGNENAKVDEYGRVVEIRLCQRFADGREQLLPLFSQSTQYDFKRFVVAEGQVVLQDIKLPQVPKGQYLIDITDVTHSDAPFFKRLPRGQILFLVA